MSPSDPASGKIYMRPAVVTFILLSLLSASLVFTGPITTGDSKHSLLLAAAIDTNGLTATKFPIDQTPGYPFFLSLVTTPVNTEAAMIPVLYYHFAMCVIIDFLVALVVFTITGSWRVALFSGVCSALMIEKSLHGGIIRNEVMFVTLLLGGLYLFILSLKRKSLLLYGAGLVLYVASGYIRPISLLFWIIPCLVFMVTMASRFREKMPHWKIGGCAVLFFITSSMLVSLLTSPLKADDASFYEKLSVLWVRTVMFQPHNEMEPILNQIDPAYIKDYESWKARREIPPGTELNPAWRGDDPWSWNYDRGWWKVKTPIYVMMSERDMTRREALRWRTDVSLQAFMMRWKQVTRSTVTDIVGAFTNEFVAWYDFSGSQLKQGFTQLGLSEGAYTTFIITHHRISKIIKIVALIGLICGCFLFRRAEYYLLVLVTLAISLVNIIFGGQGQSRYTLSYLPFVGFYLYCAYAGFCRIRSRYWNSGNSMAESDQ